MNTESARSEVSARLDQLKPDAPQRVPGLIVIPLVSTAPSALGYRSMKAAIAAGRLLVREVSEGGSVPQLVVENGDDSAVLLVDGEEVAGARQNRILNTSIYVDAHGKLVVPVSCTEIGRWGYTSRTFVDSGYVAPPSVRTSKSRSVHESLRAGLSYASDQGEVWDNISDYHRRAGTTSGTGALRDAMQQRRRDLDEARAALVHIDGQVGLVAVTADGFVAIDAVSRPDVYADLHEKLILSYVAEIVAGPERRAVELDGRVDAFLEHLRAAAVERYPSPGRGEDLRLEGRGVRGGALLVDDEVVHLGAFTEPGQPPVPAPPTGARMHRRHWRI
jgi:hypothetical protein